MCLSCSHVDSRSKQQLQARAKVLSRRLVARKSHFQTRSPQYVYSRKQRPTSSTWLFTPGIFWVFFPCLEASQFLPEVSVFCPRNMPVQTIRESTFRRSHLRNILILNLARNQYMQEESLEKLLFVWIHAGPVSALARTQENIFDIIYIYVYIRSLARPLYDRVAVFTYPRCQYKIIFGGQLFSVQIIQYMQRMYSQPVDRRKRMANYQYIGLRQGVFLTIAFSVATMNMRGGEKACMSKPPCQQKPQTRQTA